MTFDQNHCKFSGTAQNIKQIQTKTGTPMASFFLKCWKESFRIICFKEVAPQALAMKEGDRAKLVGKLQTTSWQDKEGNQRYGVQIIADKISADTDNPQDQQSKPDRKPREDKPPPTDRDQFGFRGGPF